MWFRFYHPQNQQICRVRWLWRWCGLLLPVTWAKRFCTAKICNKEDSEILCCAAPRNGAGWLSQYISEEATHILDILFPRDCRHCSNRACWFFLNRHIHWIQEAVVEESLWFLAWDCQVTVLTKGDGLKLSVNVSAMLCELSNSTLHCYSFCHWNYSTLSHASPLAMTIGCGRLEGHFERPTMQKGRDDFQNLGREIKFWIKFLFLSFVLCS